MLKALMFFTVSDVSQIPTEKRTGSPSSQCPTSSVPSPTYHCRRLPAVAHSEKVSKANPLHINEPICRGQCHPRPCGWDGVAGPAHGAKP